MIRTGVLVLTMAIAIACGPRLPMSVEEVFNEAGNDANKLGEVVQRHRVAELAALHEQFETERKGGVYGARTWEAYARKAGEIEEGYDRLREAVLEEFENRIK